MARLLALVMCCAATSAATSAAAQPAKDAEPRHPPCLGFVSKSVAVQLGRASHRVVVTSHDHNDCDAPRTRRQPLGQIKAARTRRCPVGSVAYERGDGTWAVAEGAPAAVPEVPDALLASLSDPARVEAVDAVDTAFVLGCKGGRLDLLLVGPSDGAPGGFHWLVFTASSTSPTSRRRAPAQVWSRPCES